MLGRFNSSRSAPHRIPNLASVYLNRRMSDSLSVRRTQTHPVVKEPVSLIGNGTRILRQGANCYPEGKQARSYRYGYKLVQECITAWDVPSPFFATKHVHTNRSRRSRQREWHTAALACLNPPRSTFGVFNPPRCTFGRGLN